MDATVAFFTESVLMGVALSMDAFSISLTGGIAEPDMGRGKSLSVAGTFGGFQTLMPLIGWFCVHKIVSFFSVLEKFIPWAAFFILLFIGGKMLVESFKKNEEKKPLLGLRSLIVLGIATSIDALSVGFTIADATFPFALAESCIIGIVTFGICLFGILAGKKLGAGLAGKAGILGGVILILIGVKILIEGVFFS